MWYALAQNLFSVSREDRLKAYKIDKQSRMTLDARIAEDYLFTLAVLGVKVKGDQRAVKSSTRRFA